MTIDDRLVGLILVVFGAVIATIAHGFPLMAGLPYGPGFFPTIAAVGLIVCGLVIAVSGAVRAKALAGATAPPPATADKGSLVRPALVLLVVLAFGLMLEPLGFHIAAAVAVAAAALIFGAGPLLALPLALVAAFAAHFIFYSLLRVPLPWGILTPYAW